MRISTSGCQILTWGPTLRHRSLSEERWQSKPPLGTWDWKFHYLINVNIYFNNCHGIRTNSHCATLWPIEAEWHIYASVNYTIIGSDNGLSPGRRHAIIWTNDGILFIESLETKFSEILIEIHTFSFTKMHFKMLSVKLRPFCLGLSALS